MKIKTTIIALLSLTLLQPVMAQETFTLKNTSVKITGTSSLHDWEMKANNVKGQASIKIDENKLVTVSDLNLTIPAEGLKSDKASMDKNAYEALKTSEHKNITFQITKIKSIEASVNEQIVTAEGKLQIAGVTKVIPITASGSIDTNGTIRFRGEKAFKMTDFNVKPPTLMFGSIKTGDDIKILFDITFIKTQNTVTK